MSAHTFISCSSAAKAETTTFAILEADVTPGQVLEQFGHWLATKAVVSFSASLRGENDETEQVAIDFGHISRLHANRRDLATQKYDFGITLDSVEAFLSGT